MFKSTFKIDYKRRCVSIPHFNLMSGLGASGATNDIEIA